MAKLTFNDFVKIKTNNKILSPSDMSFDEFAGQTTTTKGTNKMSFDEFVGQTTPIKKLS